MAQGSVTIYEEALPNLNFSGSASDLAGIGVDSSTIKIALISTAVTSLSAGDATPTWSDHSANEVSGNGYTSGGEAATITVSEAAGTLTVALGSGVTWTSTGTGDPSNIKTAIIYDDTSTSDLLIGYIDMTADGGTTAVDLNNGDVTINAGTIFTIS